jgi:hypothetical protein
MDPDHQFFLASPNPTCLSSRGTLDWILLASNFAIIISSSLLIANGSCSGGPLTSGGANLCVGQRLPVQAWLAIVGVEFSLLSAVVLPRAGALLISKVLTQRLTRVGLGLATLLNSQQSASKFTQVKYGMKKVAGLRLGLAAAVAGISVTYKFSFSQVDLNGIISIPLDSETPVGHTGDLGGGFFIGGPDLISPITTNIADLLQGNTQSYMWNASQTSNTSYLTIGPSINPFQGNQLVHGQVKRCKPDYYARNTLTLNFSGNSSDSPLADLTPYHNGARFYTGSLKDFVDIATTDGTLQVLFGELYEIEYGPSRYLGMLSSTMQLCAGFVSWDYDISSSAVQLHEPQDINCTSIPIGLVSGDWDASDPADSLSGGFVLTGVIIQTLLKQVDWFDPGVDPLTLRQEMITEVSSIILATYGGLISGSTSLYDISKNPKAPACREVQPQGALNFGYVASGLLHNYGTGMTIIGMTLQGLALFVALLALGLLSWPALPLLGEWPAQWLGLMDGTSRDLVREAITGTSVGQGAVRSDVWVYLSSSRAEVGCPPRLQLSTNKGQLERKCDHF